MSTPTSQELIKLLQLQSNPTEGGFLAATYQSKLKLPASTVGISDSGDRWLCNAIYYLLDRSTCSLIHRVRGDMLYHFYSGDPVEMLLLYADPSLGSSGVITFSNDVVAGGRPMQVIPGGTWIGSRVIPGGDFSLMGVTMAPGFDPSDYALGKRDELLSLFPKHAYLIKELTRE